MTIIHIWFMIGVIIDLAWLSFIVGRLTVRCDALEDDVRRLRASDAQTRHTETPDGL